MRLLVLTNGNKALIDNDDYERVVSAGNWYEDVSGHGKRTYAYRRFKDKRGIWRKVYLHTFIMSGAPDGCDIDHDDGNGLNCQKVNLVITSRTENNLNNHNIRSDNSSGHVGVWFDNFHGRWKAEIKVKGKKHNLGSFHSFEEACLARKRGEEKLKQKISI